MNLQGLINEALDLSRVESGKIELTLAPIGRPTFLAKRLAFTHEDDEEERLFVTATSAA